MYLVLSHKHTHMIVVLSYEKLWEYLLSTCAVSMHSAYIESLLTP